MSALAPALTALTCAPGNLVTIAGSGLTGATLALGGQGSPLDTFGTPGALVMPIALDPSSTDTQIAFVVPDDTVSGPLTITTTGGIAVVGLKIVSQYVQAAEYVGEGVDTSALGPGELDVVLRRASAYVDAFVGFPLRLTPIFESHTWRTNVREGSMNTRVFPFQYPITSVDSFTVRISQSQKATFPTADIVTNNDQRYIEILSYSVASYTLLGAIQNLGLVANIVELQYHAGFPANRYPSELCEATVMTATELLDYRAIQARGMGGLALVREGLTQYNRRNEPFAIPQPAKELLRPFCFRRWA